MAVLIVGYMLGVWNFLVVPHYLITLGMKGFALSLVPIILSIGLIYLELESTRRSRYMMYEFLTKAARKPGIAITLLMFLFMMVGINAYYSGHALNSLLGMNQAYAALLGILTLLIVGILLLMAKGRTLDFMATVSVLFILFAVASFVLMRGAASSAITNRQSLRYLEAALNSLSSFGGTLTVANIAQLFVATIVVFGMGVGFYYVLGSFMPEEIDVKKILAVVLVLEVALSFMASFIVVYSLGFAHQSFKESFFGGAPATQSFELYRHFNQLRAYTTNSSMSVVSSMETVYFIPTILEKGGMEGADRIAWLLMLSIYLAGLTTLIPLVEIGSQITAEMLQLGRRNSVFLIIVLGTLMTAIMYLAPVRTVLLAVPFGVGLIIAAVEAFPLLSEKKVLGEGAKAFATLSLVVFLLMGLAVVYRELRVMGLYGRVGIVLGFILLIPVLFNSALLKTRR